MKTSNVWTRKECRTCDERIPSWLFRWLKQEAEEPQYVRYDTLARYDQRSGGAASSCSRTTEETIAQLEV